MALCLRCLAGLKAPKPGVAAFSTSSGQVLAAVVEGKRRAVTKRTKKKKVEAKGKPPGEGERKALRTRIILSNSNAREVGGLEEWMYSNQRVGKMTAIPTSTLDSLRALKSFKPAQNWAYYRRPATLTTQEMTTVTDFIQKHASQEEKSMRRIITGEAGSGKSLLLLQAHIAALQADWVVFHVPQCLDLTSGRTEYAPLEGTNPLRYVQKKFIAEFLSRTALANGRVLSSMKLTQRYNLPLTVPNGVSLDKLCEVGTRDVESAWPILLALFNELSLPGRPPILFTADNIGHICRLSNHLRPDLHFIHAFDLAFVEFMVSLISGTRPLKNGGMVLAADTASHRPNIVSLDTAIKQSITHGKDAVKLPLYDVDNPYVRHDARVVEAMRKVPVLKMGRIDQESAKSLLDYIFASGLLNKPVSPAFVKERWSLSGGNVGELERWSLRSFQ